MSLKLENPNITNNPREVITQAADLLEKHPEIWGKGSWVVAEQADGRRLNMADDDYLNDPEINACTIGSICEVCLEGALLLFASDRDTFERARNIVESHLLGEIVPTEFNDNAARGLEDVVQLLRESAKGVQ